jgi:hypothetical protein
MRSPNPYDPPHTEPAAQRDESPGGLWPQSRRRRERMVGGAVRTWLLFGLRALIFLAVIVAVLILTRSSQP